MDTAYLVLGTDQNGPHLSFVNDVRERDELLDKMHDCRTSPILKLVPSNGFSEVGSSWRILFLTVPRSFQVIGELSSSASSELREKIWFSYGLASIVVVDQADEEKKELLDICHGKWRAFEEWSISNGTVEVNEIQFAEKNLFDSAHYHMPTDSVSRGTDSGNLLTSVKTGISTIVSAAAQHAPEYLPIWKKLVVEINELIGIIAGLQANARQFDTEEQAANSVREQKRINAATDHLVQIDSVLAYGISQSFGGMTPILRNRSHVQSHSLLGVGTAVKALYAFMQSVDDAFSKTPVYSVVKKAFGTVPSIDVFKFNSDLRIDEWTDNPSDVDDLIAKLNPEPISPRPHIMFFSGRLGFQEAPHSISAAVQGIPCADTVRWSLMTLSHEVMHSHVRDLLTPLFSNPTEESTAPREFSTAYEAYDHYIHQDVHPRYLIDSLRFAIFNYCRFRRNADRLTNGQGGRAADKFPTKSKLFRWFRHYFRDINEIIVHTLDFNYFYDSNASLYVDYLWESWATVPSVLADPEHYLLRTIAAVSTTCVGNLNERFEKATSDVAAQIDQLRTRHPDNVLLRQVATTLTSKRSSLKVQSIAHQYLAEMTAYCLQSAQINTSLMDDDLVESDGEQIRYSLSTGEFPSVEVQSPVALLLDRIRRLINDESQDLSDEYRSAWLFHATASALRET